MRTNIVLDEELIETAKTLTGLRTKKAVVEEGLRALIDRKRQESVRSLRGKLHWEGDLDEMRKPRVGHPR